MFNGGSVVLKMWLAVSHIFYVIVLIFKNRGVMSQNIAKLFLVGGTLPNQVFYGSK